jgi:hypothetical protein
MAAKATPAPDERKVQPPVEVRFTTRDAPWNAGDVVALPPQVAEKLVRSGVAELVGAERRTASVRRH